MLANLYKAWLLIIVRAGLCMSGFDLIPFRVRETDELIGIESNYKRIHQEGGSQYDEIRLLKPVRAP